MSQTALLHLIFNSLVISSRREKIHTLVICLMVRFDPHFVDSPNKKCVGRPQSFVHPSLLPAACRGDEEHTRAPACTPVTFYIWHLMCLYISCSMQS